MQTNKRTKRHEPKRKLFGRAMGGQERVGRGELVPGTLHIFMKMS
jgi:hypothetical protein